MQAVFFIRATIYKALLFFLFTFILSFLCVACQSKKAPPPVEWDFQKESIHIAYEAASELNQYGGSSHTLLFMVFQLSGASDFKDYTQTADGVQRLLQYQDIDQRRRIDLEDMAGMQTFFISPGAKETLKIDRFEEARWVGFVAGYFDIDPVKSSGIVRIPVEEIEEGFFRKKISLIPKDLRVDIQFGPRAMRIEKDCK